MNVVSESASLPVTVTNSLPYPISLRISSRTDSMEIVTSRFVDVNVPPGSEAQATLEIRVSTAGTTVANQELVNHEGVPLSGIHTTTITSSLQISDKSGIVFIIIAVLLGIVGLWRQFHRKKGRRMSSSIGRNSLIMASGTAASRITGQIRTILLAAAIGTTGMAANAYQAGSMIPQVIFTLVSGGVFNAVLVPHITRTLNSDNAQETLDKIVTFALTLLLGATVIIAALTPCSPAST